jgi:hypothetical protein
VWEPRANRRINKAGWSLSSHTWHCATELYKGSHAQAQIEADSKFAVPVLPSCICKVAEKAGRHLVVAHGQLETHQGRTASTASGPRYNTIALSRASDSRGSLRVLLESPGWSTCPEDGCGSEEMGVPGSEKGRLDDVNLIIDISIR